MQHRPRLVLLLAAALAAGALGAAPGPGAAADDEGPDRFRRQEIAWAECPEQGPAEMRCGTLTVPLDHADPAKGTVDLAVSRIPATGKARRGTLVFNFGGPGAPGVALLGEHVREFADLGEAYDLVAFDPRGVGRSEPVSCGGALDGAGVGDTDVARVESLRTVWKECRANSGPVLPYIGTVNVARDLDVLREVLGERKLDYLGFSYGTRIGAVYATLFPDTTGRMVLDGVDTLTEPLAEQALATAQGQQQALDNFLTWCTHQNHCVYGTNARTAKERVPALVRRLDAEPLVGYDGSYVTGQDAAWAIALGLYSKDDWPRLADALRMAEADRDPTGLLLLGGPIGPEPQPDPEPEPEPSEETVPGEETAPGEETGPGQEPGRPEPGRPEPGAFPWARMQRGSVDAYGVPPDNFAAALIAVNCADDPDRVGAGGAGRVLADMRALEAEFRKASPVFGPGQLSTVLSCYGRPAGTDFVRELRRTAGPPLLLVGTRGDPATPYRWTEETAARLGRTVVLDHKGEGHVAYRASPCVRERVNAFLVDGSLPHGTRSCPAGE
ncbi:alpha/beta hydrolase [Streptomyces sp. NPDC101118]|uniref:alpha/beta hydrolase n=1 Tax=Streptomyces sp. NPDC101118 TaxID=3366109 RepID=UPI00382650F1